MKGVSFYSYCIACLMVTTLGYGFATANYYQQKDEISVKLDKTITVDYTTDAAEKYNTVQSAIDSIPPNNQKWIHIFIKSGIYKEKVTIPKDKGYIYLQGEGIQKTIIAYDGHRATDTSATFTAYSDYIVISGITFKNTYNVPLITHLANPIKPAVAARMLGDKYVIIDSSFDGLQDTLFDALGRHYYKRCIISGGVDIIFGYAQSLFEGCTLNLTVGIYAPENPYGSITAQGRKSPEDNGGFFFKDCTVCSAVKGKTLLGRAWEPYARVIFYRSNLTDVILPIGWDAWRAKGQEGNTMFVEYGCTGAGADTSHRVSWMKKASEKDVLNFTNVSFIDQDGWLESLPIIV